MRQKKTSNEKLLNCYSKNEYLTDHTFFTGTEYLTDHIFFTGTKIPKLKLVLQQWISDSTRTVLQDYLFRTSGVHS